MNYSTSLTYILRKSFRLNWSVYMARIFTELKILMYIIFLLKLAAVSRVS